jgi:hypothetical protein
MGTAQSPDQAPPREPSKKEKTMTLIRSLSNGNVLLALAAFAAPAAAVEPINFEVRNNADLVALCSTAPTDPNYVAAIHFCHGVAVGVVRYYEALNEGKTIRQLFCFPEGLTRNQAIAQYVSYSKAHPEYDTSSIGDVMTKFLVDSYPCGKAPQAKKP